MERSQTELMRWCRVDKWSICLDAWVSKRVVRVQEPLTGHYSSIDNKSSAVSHGALESNLPNCAVCNLLMR